VNDEKRTHFLTSKQFKLNLESDEFVVSFKEIFQLSLARYHSVIQLYQNWNDSLFVRPAGLGLDGGDFSVGLRLRLRTILSA
jgi:hypothetical protein